MGESLYTIRNGQGYFESGMARGRQALIGNTVHEIVVHWFDMEGHFLGLERTPMDVDPPRFPGCAIYHTGSDYHQAVDNAMAGLKTALGFEPSEIRVRRFASEEASISDLPGEYEAYLEDPEPFDEEEWGDMEESIAEWRAKGRFVVDWCVDYWMNADGEVISHG